MLSAGSQPGQGAGERGVPEGEESPGLAGTCSHAQVEPGGATQETCLNCYMFMFYYLQTYTTYIINKFGFVSVKVVKHLNGGCTLKQSRAVGPILCSLMLSCVIL